MSNYLQHRNSGWILVAGFALVALGLVAESRPGAPTEPSNLSIPGVSTSFGGFAPAQEEEQTFTPPVALPVTPGYGTADSNGSMIAVTGVDVTGGSLLYLIDTETRHLSVYQATGGTKSTMNLQWVGGRNIDLDMQVDGFNDKSEYSFKELSSRFESKGSAAVPERRK